MTKVITYCHLNKIYKKFTLGSLRIHNLLRQDITFKINQTGNWKILASKSTLKLKIEDLCELKIGRSIIKLSDISKIHSKFSFTSFSPIKQRKINCNLISFNRFCFVSSQK
jgi:hypothetical protein